MRPNLLQDISSATNRSQFEACLLEFTAAAGFEIGSAVVVLEQPTGAPRVHMVGNTPEAWIQAHRDPQNVRRDPVLKMLQVQSTPVIYDQAVYVAAGAGDMWERQAAFGYHTGVAVATHLPGGRHLLLGTDRRAPLPRSVAKMNRLMADMYLFAVYAQSAAEQCLKAELGAATDAGAPDCQAPPEAAVELDQTDLEILNWAASGKSSWTIGMLLNLSETVVHRRMSRVRERLGVATRQQAIARAVALNLVKL